MFFIMFLATILIFKLNLNFLNILIFVIIRAEIPSFFFKIYYFLKINN